MELLRFADDLDLYQVNDSEMAAAAVLMGDRGFGIDPAAAAGVACALFRVVRRKHKDLVVIITGRGAKVSAERLREEGLLDLPDNEIQEVAPRGPEVFARDIVCRPEQRILAVSEDSCF